MRAQGGARGEVARASPLGFVATATVLLAGAVAVLGPVPVLLVRSEAGADLSVTVLRGPVEVRLEYVHSVERTPVVEVYVAEPGLFRFVRMEFVSQGAGLPTSGYVREGDQFVLRSERRLPDLPIRVSGRSSPRLVVNGEMLDLMALVGDGALVRVSVGSRTRLPLPGR